MRASKTESDPFSLAADGTSSILAARLPSMAVNQNKLDWGPKIPTWKRVIDTLAVLLSLPLVLPLSGLIILWIKCVSPGPPVFRQTRIGFCGQRFTCFKFRSMHVSADSAAHQRHVRNLMKANKPLRKLDAQDPRLIPLGHLLRASGLDELPQLFNVLRGEMSLVGPRPCLPYEFEQCLPWQQRRCDVLPGLTGLWQVSGKNSTTHKEMIELDLRYVREVSLRMDMVIILKTFGTLLQQVQEWKSATKRTQGGSGVCKPSLTSA